MIARSRKPLFLGLGLATGVLVLGHFIGGRPLRRSTSALPSRIAEVARRHLPPEDYRAFDEAVTAHVVAGRPLTKAAVMMLAAIHLEPAHVEAIRVELTAKGLI